MDHNKQLDELYSMYNHAYAESLKPQITVTESRESPKAPPSVNTVTRPPKPDVAALNGMLQIVRLKMAGSGSNTPPIAKILAVLDGIVNTEVDLEVPDADSDQQ